MNIVSHKTLRDFYQKHPAARSSVEAWYRVARRSRWASPQDVKRDFNSVDFVADSRAIFNIGGNNYRLVVRISYQRQSMMVKFIGTHKEYDDIDPSTV